MVSLTRVEPDLFAGSCPRAELPRDTLVAVLLHGDALDSAEIIGDTRVDNGRDRQIDGK